uniref:Flap endonuclease 1 n=1 Tax=Lotharella oceanica TaxID=641309 RepID=A0A7S2TXG7_9EUKA|mmetsp:Transcript_34254/g.63530  ORF Transcript_34254/g.63530 Transcript_34254/m.63530 type:complete len:373 (+) Transcript_34254:74-1192(+)|eukprot:CAMPEP_0170173694 /NCGR_PEP_ID=MMETSP0040_2-20121228/6973_1 /TAXON_ID=641309 /ORGANISM="Lotharella oceanica, Strain CCMP622" /LENGTH=372 /DNA_ID=CAMNT_0010415001 /DNA_START=45 /DNA_END=1163 /DNA_ORIENTATION=-
MGIKGLMKFISDTAPDAVKEGEIKSYFGRKVAIDASMSLYQFLIAVRSGPDAQMLTNEAGEVTSHLQGLFHRTIRMMDNGVKPVYVFDGKAPVLKSGELEIRKEAKKKAQEELKKAKESGDQAEINKFSRRLVRVTREQNEECKRLLKLMGVPSVDAAGEAEAQCAQLCKEGHVFGTATEDMDALTFGTPKLLRHMTFSEARKAAIVEIELKTVLEQTGLTMDQFIDFCILCGCDYTMAIRGIGPKSAYKLIKKHGNIEGVLENLNKDKYKIDSNAFLFKEARELFRKPDVSDTKNIKLTWAPPDEEGLVEFLCKEKGFEEGRVRNAVKKLRKARNKGSQKRLESFFGPVTITKRKKAPVKEKKKGKKKAKK